MGGERVVRALGVFAVTCGVFLIAVHGGFIMIDDPVYVVTNPLVGEGLTWRGAARAFVTPVADLWLPISLISHMADVSMWGLDPVGHHLTNVLLHGLNAVLVFLVLERLTAKSWQSVAVALLFALHPLRVESVAWVSERKDLLSACFALLTVDAYARWAQQPNRSRYLAMCALFAVGLLAKPMLVTVPFLLLLLDHWPLQRAGIPWTKRVLEKVPLVSLACAASWATLHVAVNARVSFAELPLSVRAGNAVVSYVSYLRDMVWPVDLAVYYPFPPPWPAPTIATAAMLLLALGAATLLLSKRAPYLAVGYAWYLIALGPVIGLVQAGMQARADRFTYLPSIGILVAIVWGMAALVDRRPVLRSVAWAALALVVVGNTIATRHYLRLWQNDDVLFQHALEVTERNWFIHANYGDSLFFRGRIDAAVLQYEQALAIEPRTPVAQGRLASIKLQRGELDQAFDHVAQALVAEPHLKDANRTLRELLQRRGMQAKAAQVMAAELRDEMARAGRDMMRAGGSPYRRSLGSALWRQHGGTVARCRTEMGPAAAFGLFFTVGGRGEISDVVASPPSALGQCLAAGLTGTTLPVPPFAPFHALMTMQLGA